MKKLFDWFRWFKREDRNVPNPPACMDIQEFVHASITGIMSGIRRAQKEYAAGNSAYAPLICPAWAPPISGIGGGAKGHADKMHELEFDLAITISNTSSARAHGEAGVQVIGVYTGDLGCSAESAGTHSSISRIKFKVPVRYPLTKLGKAEWDAERE